MKQLLIEFKNIDAKIVNIIKAGIKFSFSISIIASLILLTYELLYTTPITYYIGISLFKTSLFFISFFIICGLSFNRIKLDLKN